MDICRKMAYCVRFVQNIRHILAHPEQRHRRAAARERINSGNLHITPASENAVDIFSLRSAAPVQMRNDVGIYEAAILIEKNRGRREGIITDHFDLFQQILIQPGRRSIKRTEQICFAKLIFFSRKNLIMIRFLTPAFRFQFFIHQRHFYC